MMSRIILVCLFLLFLHPGFAQPTPPALPSGQMLDAWAFETTNWTSLFHETPLAFTNLTLYPDWAGNGLLLDTTNPAFLNYAVLTAEGWTNLALTNGTLTVWFSPDWNTADGPGNWGTLLEVGTWQTNLADATGAWGLYFSPDGANLYFSAQTNGSWTNYLAAPINWYAGDWHQITLAYSLTNTALYLEGAFVTNGPGISVGPSATIISNGFSVGSDGFDTALLQARGMFNDLVTYDYLLDAATVSNYYAEEAQNVFPLPASGGGFSGDYSPPSPGGGGSYTNDGGGPVGSYNDPAYGSNQFWIEIVPFGTNSNSSTSNYLSLILHNTQADTAYEIESTTNLQEFNMWKVEETIIGSETTNFTPFVVSMIGRSNLFLRAFNGTLDTDGDGLPDFWEIKYSTSGFPLSATNADTGNTGIPDGYKLDSAGDGYNNLQKYQMGVPPNVFITPPAPTGFQVVLQSNGTVVVSWNPAANLPTNGAGAVTGYKLSYFVNGVASNIVLAAGTSNYTFSVLSNAAFAASFTNTVENNDWSLQVNYARTNSLSVAAPDGWYNSSLVVETYLVRGSGGRPTLIFPNIPTNVAAIRVYACGCWYSDTTYTFDVPVSSFTNNLYVCPNSPAQIPFYPDQTDTNFPCIIDTGEASYVYYTRPIGVDGSIGLFPPDVQAGTVFGSGIPFLDGTEHLQQNANFLLESANENGPLQYVQSQDGGIVYAYPANYVYAGFYQQASSEYGAWLYTGLNEFEPFSENANYRNFVYSAADLNPDGTLQSGVYYDTYDWYDANGNSWPLATIPGPAPYYFDSYGFMLNGSTNPPAPLLGGLPYLGVPQGSGAAVDILQNGDQITMDAAVNHFGLAYAGAEIAHSYVTDSGATNLGVTALSLGGTYTQQTDDEQDTFYTKTVAPTFQTAGYYFARPYFDVLPSEAGNAFNGLASGPTFGVTNTSPLILEPLGVAGYPITAWAKEQLLNGNTNVFAFVEQYLDAAYTTDTNGNITTNSAAVVSEYGEFFATQPGKILLVTRTNLFGQRGTNVVNVISLALDANHDGIMDLSAFGPDFTSPARYFEFWLNNNYDRLTFDSADDAFYDDDVLVAGCPFANVPTSDCNFMNGTGNRVIPCQRDLQDFARLWVVGVSNCLAGLPTGSKVTLSWGDVGSPNYSNPTIDLFTAADPDGGIGYLTNSTIAATQTNALLTPYMGRLGPGQSIQLNECFISNCWRGDHFIWCGVSNGIGGLTLTIQDANSNTLAQTKAYVQIKDIKDMYERWTVGDALSITPMTNALLACNDLPAGETIPFQYPKPSDTNTPYILYVHGWNMEPWEKARFAESAFKRLYWQGYQGRFGVFQWPTGNGFTGLTTIISDPTEKDNYDSSEYQAWLSGQGLLNKLRGLNAEYPNHVYLLAHSMGNVVAGEALRLSGSNQVANTYVASQAAISAHTYDTNIANYSFSYLPYSSSAETPNIYGNWFAGNTGGGAGSVISFFNTNDYALARARWQFDQLVKPDYNVAEGLISWDYLYGGSASDPAPWNNFYKQNHETTSSKVYFDIVDVLTNRYEVMAYAAQSWTTALGATPDVANINEDIDLTRLGSPIWPPDPTGREYVAHFWHSAQFRGDYWQQNGYWSELLGTEVFKLK